MVIQHGTPDEDAQKEGNDAAAELLRMYYETVPPIHSCGRKGSIVWATTSDGGVHRGNALYDFKTDIHLVCDTDEVTVDMPDGSGPIFWNEAVSGLAEDPHGPALPTHRQTKRGPRIRDELDPDLYDLADRAGLDLDGVDRA